MTEPTLEDLIIELARVSEQLGRESNALHAAAEEYCRVRGIPFTNKEGA